MISSTAMERVWISQEIDGKYNKIDPRVTSLNAKVTNFHCTALYIRSAVSREQERWFSYLDPIQGERGRDVAV